MPAPLLLLLAAAVPPSDPRCSALASFGDAAVRIERAEPIVGTFTAPDGETVGIAPACRVAGVASPVRGSRIGFELWLPRDGWNGRYSQLGSGGFGGGIHYPSLAAEIARGNAVAASDSGHRAGPFDARWAAGNPVAVADYGHRSIKATADAAARLLAAYYGRPARYRYFVGCSNGGRQALMAAERYPDDWEGILAGAPASAWTWQLRTFARIQMRLRNAPSAWIAADKLPLVQREALASCPRGTVVAGVALAPLRCRFEAGRLRCRGKPRTTCLTAAEVASLRPILGAGYQPTSAALRDNWTRWIVNPDRDAPSQLTFAEQARRFLSPYDPAWLRQTLDADLPSLSRFAARGGKLLSYFGWADAVISPRLALRYRHQVERRFGRDAAKRFYRLFMVPGMTHCQGGEGATSFGQSLDAPSLADDRTHDIRRALEAWVEQGVAPEVLVARDTAGPGTRHLHPR